MAKKLGLMILLLVIMLVSCSKSNDCALASPQKSRPSSEWRRKLIPVRSSRSPRSPSYAPRNPPLPPPPPPLSPSSPSN
ncbi:predicted protein [Arabidopsis lyrata subsp. lyrata]|uniref:Predicted protein n=1 Tax=Arabidopsis lyrata subsp. lyrata TaxID=81972 RepID=D7MLZ4_ARALL|nr:ras and Rab interactor 3 [Arabidopsis lyrata subsp. lyrata]XP_020871274.1 ras and Rab interactor 3 [Arabidopsis lyrata subsp. lyrata]XP_020871275.1 ras and Rab interactor 3 [Arabidopsis lyrata subsp. lyrata]XP_020871276.1 ras and Rab interactor 3 [Arabidopsis lyrata subsp. lyrata]EFH41614.1 predicted protein [Arabidopsis lyrata subsp. lyrata]|eukprot:XP_002865355.1 ras and Rab interactor 3 [Arabidopsis lyrata subsp. lyrata]